MTKSGRVFESLVYPLFTDLSYLMIYINVWIRFFGALQNVGVPHPPFFACIVHLFEPFGELEGLYD